MTAAAILHLPLGLLRPGHEANPPVNVRVAADDASVAALARNMADRLAAGKPALVEPLTVVEGPKPRGRERLYYVANGGRRLLALQRLAAAGGTLAETLTLPVLVQPRAEGLEASTTAAVLSQPHHPIDQLEAFAQLWPDRPEAERVALIAARFAMAPKRVRQILALGSLAPAVRAAWRTGEIDARQMQAFAVEPDHREQERVLDAIQGRSHWDRTPHMIRRLLIAGRIEATDLEVALVGLDTYRAAGGTLTGDLFSGQRFIADRPLFDRLLERRRAEIETEIFKAGWGFAFWSTDDRALGWRGWTRIHNAGRLEPVWTPEAEAEHDRLTNELAAIAASSHATTAPADDDTDNTDDDSDPADEPDAVEPPADPLGEEFELDAADGSDEQDEDEAEEETAPLAARAAWIRARLGQLDRDAFAAAIPADARAGLAAIVAPQVLVGGACAVAIHYGYVPPAFAGAQAHDNPDDADPDEDEDDRHSEQNGASGPASDEGAPSGTAGEVSTNDDSPALPRAALQSLSLVANRAAAATVAADPDLALTLLAAAWIARAGSRVHEPGNGVPLIVSSNGLNQGPLADRIATLVAGEGGAKGRWGTERAPHFAGLVRAIGAMPRAERLSLVAALAAGALDLSNDTLENRNSHAGQKNVNANGHTALMTALPPATFATNARLLLAGSGEAEALFADWPKAALVDAIRDMDGEDAAKQAAKAKKGDLVALTAARALATGWLPVSLRLAVEAETEGPVNG
ncbi:hypothetical protein [Phreatobacter sp.]|uniref:hypothetical protein n=1 Tax=Phreatobacter sp. TaxID=1966341 RepID=UPI003F724E4B